MSNIKDFLLQIPGTAQSQRHAPSSKEMEVSGRTFEDLVKRTAEFARGVVFYSDNNEIDGNWSDFFKKIYDYDKKVVLTDVIDSMKESSSVEPHLALMFAFFELLLVEQEEINKIPSRQMEFYYKDILGFQKKQSQDGNATVYIELGKKVDSVSIPKGTKFDAGKDEDGKSRTFMSVDDIRVGNDSIAALATYDNENGFKPLDDSAAEGRHALYFTSEYLNQPGVNLTFGFMDWRVYTEKVTTLLDEITHGNGKKLDLAEIIEIAASETFLADEKLRDFSVEYTTSEGWEMAFIYNASDLIPGINMKGVFWSINESMTPIAPYNKNVHGLGFETSSPIIRFTPINGLSDLSSLSSADYKKLSIFVQNAYNFTIKNNAGVVENNAGVNPFGANCKQGDTFTIEYPFQVYSPNIFCTFKDNTIKTESSIIYGDDSSEKGRIFTLKSDNCDQAKLASEYSKYVLQWMEKNNGASTGSTTDNNSSSSEIFSKGLVAASPILQEKIKISSAHYIDKSVKSCFVTPYGHIDTSSSSSFVDNTRLLDGQSALYIGLKGLQGYDNNISIHVTVKDSNDPDVSEAKLSWSYLRGNKWISFPSKDIHKDTTKGLLKSGIVMLSTPEGIFEPHTWMTPEYQWIRVIADNTNALNVTSARAQALEVSFDPESSGKSLYGKALPEKTITKLSKSITGLKAVSQPETGEDGILEEDEKMFLLRASEQLRHKGRAWSIWDYEHLILEKFQNVSYVKCLSSCNKDGEYSPGEITLVVIPSVKNNDLKPSIGGVLKNEIKDFIKSVSSPFVTVNVISPSYQEIKVNAEIHLKKEYTDTARYQGEIMESLNSFLCPHSSATDNHFKNGDTKTDIIAFLEGIPCIDYIDTIDILVNNVTVEEDEILLTKPHQIFTSAQKHDVRCKLAE